MTEIAMTYSIEHYERFLRVKNSARYYTPDGRPPEGGQWAAIEQDLRDNIDPELIRGSGNEFIRERTNTPPDGLKIIEITE